MTQDSEFAFRPAAGGLDISLEQFDAVDCPNQRVPYLLGLNPKKQKAVIFRPRCKLWSCPVCGKANAWVWSFRANEGAHRLHNAGRDLAFVTITPHEKLSPGQSWWVMPKAWMKLQARVRRQCGKVEYFAVPELHKSGKVHIHMITTAKASKRWWKTNGRECGFGFQNDMREVHEAGGVIGYVNKYLVKGLDTTNIPKGTRRVRTSRGWPKLGERDPPADWSFNLIPQRRSLADLAGGLWDLGYEVVFAGSKTAWRHVAPDD